MQQPNEAAAACSSTPLAREEVLKVLERRYGETLDIELPQGEGSPAHAVRVALQGVALDLGLRINPFSFVPKPR